MPDVCDEVVCFFMYLYIRDTLGRIEQTKEGSRKCGLSIPFDYNISITLILFSELLPSVWRALVARKCSI